MNETFAPPLAAARARIAAVRPAAYARTRNALDGAFSGRSSCIDEPQFAPWLARWAECCAGPALFPAVDRRCDSFSQRWARASRGLDTGVDLLAVDEVPAW